jgi:signal transduction histidine kinase/ActR/RegA family two-component response regulator
MNADWRFRESPHVAEGGLRAYAGVPLRFDTEFGEPVAFGSLCVASNSPQAELSISQQRSLAQLADWVVADIIHSARARRHRERRHMLELTSKMQSLCDQGANMEEKIIEMLHEVYPQATIGVYRTTTGRIHLEGGTELETSELVHGLWEDCEHFDQMIIQSNHQDLVASRIVRAIASQCSSERTPTFLLVGSKNFGQVFDDVDSGFIQMCTTTLCRYWQSRVLKEALEAKDTFLRGITHQLRTPIHGIIGSVELLTEELRSRAVISHAPSSPGHMLPEDDEYDPYTYIKTIKTSARDLIATINSLIKLNQWTDIAQAERTYACHSIRAVESALLKEAAAGLPDDMADRPTFVISHRLPARCDSLTIDMRLFLDVVAPIIVNAAQNTPGGIVCVTLSVTDDLHSLIVDVEDNGRGIPVAWHKRIFKAYEKIDAYTIEAGLGLTLASRSALLMDGTVSLLSSELGKGAHFRASFAELKCVCSAAIQPPIREQFARLPPTFFQIPTGSGTSETDSLSLSRLFGRYLESSGFVNSSTIEGCLCIVDYDADLTQLYEKIAQVPNGQLVICMVPEHEPLPTHPGSALAQIQDKTIFVQGPFLSDILDEALANAATTLEEFTSRTIQSKPCACGDAALHNLKSTLTLDTSTAEPESPPCTPEMGSSCTSLMDTTMAEAEYVKPIHQLRIIAQPSSPRGPPSLRFPTPMVLLVDDNAVNLRLLEMYCTRRKFAYRTARDGADAVRLFAEGRASDDPNLAAQPFNLVLMDLQMPVCDGINATRQIRHLEEQNRWDRSVVCIVTGQDSPADRNDASGAGSDGYLVKPVGPKVLDRWVKQWFTGTGIV